MSRLLKALGLVSILIVAVSVTGVPEALASNAQLTLATSPGVLDGTQTSAQTFNRLGRKWNCAISNLSATAKTGATTITVTPTYENCTTSLGGPATFTVTGCDYLLHLTADASDNFTADTDLVCETGGHIVVDAYLSAAHHTEGKIDCQYTYGAAGNQGLNTIKLTNHTGANNDIDADLEVRNITSTRTMGTTLLCGAENDATATWEGGATLKGTTEAGLANGITVSTD
jgi:hypothetical protein